MYEAYIKDSIILQSFIAYSTFNYCKKSWVNSNEIYTMLEVYSVYANFSAYNSRQLLLRSTHVLTSGCWKQRRDTIIAYCIMRKHYHKIDIETICHVVIVTDLDPKLNHDTFHSCKIHKYEIVFTMWTQLYIRSMF